MIIHVDGAPGSGKSWTCKELKKIKNIVCIDTDDIIYLAHDKLRGSKKYMSELKKNDGQSKLFNKTADAIRDKLIKKNAHSIIVFVGTTMPIPKPKYKFFIQIDDPDKVYRRFLLREFNKIFDHKKEITRLAEKYDIELAGMEIRMVTGLAVDQPVDFKDFLIDYHERIINANKKKYHIMSQKEIIETIKKIAAGFKCC